MKPSSPSTGPFEGLSGLGELLPPAKALAAQRLVAAGRVPDESGFDQQGLRLSPAESRTLSDWLATGLCTRVLEQVRAPDGTVKLLLGLGDGKAVETVVMPDGACCVSTQVGCAVGCHFCASGLAGLDRNLTVDEIVEQVVHARRLKPIDRVVFMGMGEPAHNLDHVLAAVARLEVEARIAPRRQTLSTVGGVSVFERMARAVARPRLAVSLHLADDARRRELLPHAPRDPVADLVAAADTYGRTSGDRVQFEWTLLAGINDGERDIDQLCALLRGVGGYVNFIVYNPVAGLPFMAPTRARIVEIARAVKAAGILAKIRDSSGQGAEAACGQLRLHVRA